MRVLVAEDDAASRKVLEIMLSQAGYEPVIVHDGHAALEALSSPEGPRLAVLDWMMPGLEGPEVCRRVRALPFGDDHFIVFVTARTLSRDVAEGLQAGANDYVAKPFDRVELLARLGVGVRMLRLREALAENVRALQAALDQVRVLSGLLPICCYCKNVRSSDDYWQRIEEYISSRTDAEFTHGICPDCYEVALQR